MRTLKSLLELGLILGLAVVSLGFFSGLKMEYYLYQANRAYETGTFPEALEAYQSAAENGSGEAYYRLYSMYMDGEGTSKNKITAAQMLQKAVELKYPGAQVSKGILLIYSQNPNYQEGIRLLNEAAYQESSLAYYHLAYLYFYGRAVPKDMNKAREYQRLAKAFGMEVRFPVRERPMIQKVNTPKKTAVTNIKELTTNIQINLKKLGFFSSKVDGQMGPMTRKSIKAFQIEYGFPVDTEISEKVLRQTTKSLEEQ